MAHKNFSSEYNVIRDILSKYSFEGSLQKPMEDLKGILGVDGPRLTQLAKLDHLRDVALKLKETEKILEGAGVEGKSAPTKDQFEKTAAIKFLRHLHMSGERGGQTVWVFSTPKGYSNFPYDELDAVKNSLSAFKTKVDDIEEQFDSATKQRLAEATQLALYWCQKALITLSNAESDESAMAIVKRWFAAGNTSDADVTTTMGRLSDGFKKITNTLNNNMLVITDLPPFRNNSDYDYAEAFIKTIAGKVEIPRTMYIEKALFSNFDISVLHDMKKNWARVLVHECSHIDAGTEDFGYAYQGIKPGTKITPDNAAVNADSWAFFAADAAGALVENDLIRALGGTGGNLTKLPENWD